MRAFIDFGVPREPPDANVPTPAIVPERPASRLQKMQWAMQRQKQAAALYQPAPVPQ